MKRQLGFLALSLTCSLAAGAAESWTLERALDYALSHSPDACLAQQRIMATQAGLEQADSAFWPHLQFQSSYTRMDNPMMVFGSILNQRAYNSSLNFNDVPDVDDLNVRGLVTVPLYAGGKIKAGRDAAKANTEAAKQTSAAVRNELGFEVVRAFQTILETRQFVKATQAAVTALEGNQATAMKRLVGGTLLKSDELDIEVRLRQACEDLVRARNANTLAVLALRNLLGMESGEFAVADTAPKATVPSGDDFSHRPEIAAAHERERAAAAEMRGAQSGYQPSVSAFGSLDHDYGWVTGGDGNSYTAGVMLQWDLWDGFSSRAKTREASANLESAREEQRKLRLALNFEVEQAQLDLSAANERLAVTETSIEQALESEKLTRDRFEQGLAISTQLIDAETALVAARVRRAEAESDQPIAVAGLRKALALPQLDGQPTAK